MSTGKRMNKRTRTLLLSGIAVVVLGGLLAGLLILLPETGGADTSSEVSSSPSISLLDKTKGSDGNTAEKPVKSLSVQLENETFSFVDQDGELVVERYKDLPVNTYAVENLMSTVAGITATQKVGAVDNPADFGLDKPKAAVSATYHDDSSYAFELGGETPLKDGYYFRKTGETDVYIVDSSFGETVSAPSTAYIGLTLMSPPVVKSDDSGGQAVLRDMALSGRVREKQPMAFQMTTTEDSNTSLSFYTYKFTTPYLRGMNSNKSSSLSSFTSLSASEAAKAYPTKEDLAAYGLDKPYSVAKLNLAVSTLVDDPDASSTASSGSETAQKTSYYNVTPHTITVGDKTKEDLYPVLIDDVPVVYLVAASSIESWVEVQYEDLVDNMLFLQDITTLKSVSLTLDGKETVFALAHHPEKEESADKLTVTAGGKTYDTEEFRTLYQVMMGISRAGTAPSKPTGTPDLILRVTPENSADKGILASFYAYSPSLYTCVLENGEYFQVKASHISWLKTQFENYLDGKPVKGFS